MTLRTAILGVGHWHAKFIFDALRSDSHVIAVSDPDPAMLTAAARALDCRPYADFRALLDSEHIDAAFVYGRHCDMAGMAEELVTRGIAFAIEKPGGLTATDVAAVRDKAAAAGLFVSVPFTHRITPWVRQIMAEGAGETCHAAFRLLSGPPSRYVDSGVPWALRPAESGGGCTINLSVLFVDLVRHLTGRDLELVNVSMSARTHGLDVEDYSSLSLRTDDGSAVATIETGYTYPLQDGADLRASVRTRRSYYLADAESLTIVAPTGRTQTSMRTHHRDYYDQFARSTLRAIAAGEPPLAALDDLHRAMLIIDEAYKVAGRR